MKNDILQSRKILGELIINLLNKAIAQRLNTSNSETDIARCNRCGFPWSEFAQKELPGCDHCNHKHYYALNAKKMMNLMIGLSTSTRSDRSILAYIPSVEVLKNQLQRAIEFEDFLKAANLRDRIAGLKRLESNNGKRRPIYYPCSAICLAEWGCGLILN